MESRCSNDSIPGRRHHLIYHLHPLLRLFCHHLHLHTTKRRRAAGGEKGGRARTETGRDLASCRREFTCDSACETHADSPTSSSGHAAPVHPSITTIYNLNIPTVSSVSTTNTSDSTTVLSLSTITSTAITTPWVASES